MLLDSATAVDRAAARSADMGGRLLLLPATTEPLKAGESHGDSAAHEAEGTDALAVDQPADTEEEKNGKPSEPREADSVRFHARQIACEFRWSAQHLVECL
jgi:hypothetical protein